MLTNQVLSFQVPLHIWKKKTLVCSGEAERENKQPRGASTGRNAWYHLFVREISPRVLFYVVYIEKSQRGLPEGLSSTATVCSAAPRAASHSTAGTACFCGAPVGKNRDV